MGSALWEQKKTEMVQKLSVGLCIFEATYGNEVISLGGHKKLQTYGTVNAFRNTVQTSLRGRGAPKDQITAIVMPAVAAADEHYDNKLCILPVYLCILPVYYLTGHLYRVWTEWIAKAYSTKRSRLRWSSEQAY